MKFNVLFRGMTALGMVLFITLNVQSSPPAKYSPVGTWEYNVPGVPVEYENGLFVITEGEDGLVVEIGPSREYLIKAEKIEYSKKKINFVVYVEYEEVKISGVFDDDNFQGKVSYSEGEFDLSAVKVPES